MMITTGLLEMPMCDFWCKKSRITCKVGGACIIFVLSEREPEFAGACSSKISCVHQQSFLRTRPKMVSSQARNSDRANFQF